MDYKAILEILRFVSKSDLTEVEIQEGDFSLLVKRGQQTVYSYAPAPVAAPVYAQAPAQLTPAAAPAAVSPAPNEGGASSAASTAAAPAAKLLEVRAPMVGTFYRSGGPDKEPFVKVGDLVHKGQVLCIIEAMKLFNEIESEFDGRIVDILPENKQPVEYDQLLFHIEPTH